MNPVGEGERMDGATGARRRPLVHSTRDRLDPTILVSTPPSLCVREPLPVRRLPFKARRAVCRFLEGSTPTLSAISSPAKLCRSPLASKKPGSMLAVALFQ